MAGRFADVSRYRNSVFAAHKKEEWYSFDRASSSPGAEAWSGIDANSEFIAFKAHSGSNVSIVSLAKPGKPTHVSEIGVVGTNPTCLTLSPHFSSESHLLAVGGDNGTVALAHLEAKEGIVGSASVTALQGHSKRVEAVVFHPTASGIIGSAAGHEAFIWDVEKREARVKVTDQKDIVWSLDFAGDGAVFATTAKDATLRLYDTRAGGAATESVVASHGPKAWRATFLTGVSPDHILTTGFSSQRQRELKTWDRRSLSKPTSTKAIDSDPSVLIPVYDPDSSMLVLGARGSPVIRWYDVKATGLTDSASNYSGRDVLAGLCAVPKPALDVMKCEVLRLLAPTADGMSVIPISANVPRRSYLDFQAELYPETRAGVSALDAEKFWAGETADLPTMSLDPRKRASAPMAALTAAKPEPAASPTTSSETKPAETPIIVAAATSVEAPVEEIRDLSIKESAVAEPDSTSAAIPTAASTPPVVASSMSSTSIAAPPKPVAPIKSTGFRFLTGTGHVKFDSLRSLSIVIPNESDAIAANDFLIAVPIAGPGGRIGIIYTETAGKPNAPTRLPAQIPCLLNGSDVHDFAIDPFDSGRVAVACDDGKIRMWKVLPGMEGDRDAASVDSVISAHASRANVIKFHPRAKDVLLCCSSDLKVKIWDLKEGKSLIEIAVPDSSLAAAWSTDGTKIAIAGRDKKLRVFDARSGEKKHEWDSHDGIKGARVDWLGDSGRLVSTGFGKASKREINVYDLKSDATAPLKTTGIDQNPGIPCIHYDEDLGILFFAGRGDRNVSIWSIGDDGTASLQTRYEAGHVQQGFAFFPKTGLDVTKVEVNRCWRVNSGNIEDISFILPRSRTELFQDNVFPPTWDRKPTVESAAEWFAGKDGEPVKISLKPASMKNLSEAAEEAAVAAKAGPAPVSQKSRIGEDAEKAFVNTLLTAARNHDDEKEDWESKKEGVDPEEWD